MDLYQQNILDYYKHPRCKGTVTSVTNTGEVANTLCGDRVVVALKVEDAVIKEARWQGEGCVLSLASADMLMEYLEHRPLTEVASVNEAWIIKTLGVTPGPNRLKCALLPLEALKKALALRN